MTNRIYNFSAGPAVLPESVIKKAQESLWAYGNSGVGICEMSHRSKEFTQIINEAKSDLKELTGAGDDFEVLLMQGGASLQFHMVPLNLAQNKTPVYINTGAWSKKAIAEAKRLGDVKVLATGEESNFSVLPDLSQIEIPEDAPYVHYTSNNTIFGTQFHTLPPNGKSALICDASSDFLCGPIDLNPFGMIYGGAQKNLGPAGVTVALIRKELLNRSPETLPPLLSYQQISKSESLYNTAPVFPIYVFGEVLKWIKENGGLSGMKEKNQEKASLLYDALDSSSFYNGTAQKEHRSLMNVTFRLPSEELEAKFIKEGLEKGFSGLKGHRSVGGVRASIYNAFPKAGIEALVEFMKEFEAQAGA